MSAAMTLASCGGTKDAGQQQDAAALIQRSDIKIEGKRMTPEALWAMGRIGSVAVSPDEKQIAYTVSYYSVPQNKSNSEVFVMNADGSGNTQITHDAWQEGQPTWFKDGKKLAFLCNESGSSQVWEMNPDGSGRKQLTQYEGDIEGFSFSPDGKKLLFIAQVKTVKSTADKHPDLPKATGIIVTDLMYKHWDEWVTTAPHPFVADFDGNAISNVTDILEGEPYESPMKPGAVSSSWHGARLLIRWPIHAVRKPDWRMPFPPTPTFISTTLPPRKPKTSRKKTRDMTRIPNTLPTANTSPGRAWSVTATKPT